MDVFVIVFFSGHRITRQLRKFVWPWHGFTSLINLILRCPFFSGVAVVGCSSTRDFVITNVILRVHRTTTTVYDYSAFLFVSTIKTHFLIPNLANSSPGRINFHLFAKATKKRPAVTEGPPLPCSSTGCTVQQVRRKNAWQIGECRKVWLTRLEAYNLKLKWEIIKY